VVTLIARLVPIKRVDRFLRLAIALGDIPDARFVIVGDGELRDSLRDSPEARVLGSRLIWTGFRRDMPAVYFASDLVVQTSDNEGTPVSLIEAQAAGVPVLSTRVGGTESAVGDPGRLAPVDDEAALARAARALLEDAPRAAATAAAARERVLASFALARLVADVEALYRELLSPRRP
jgi:glycosyltransferase involved in cell wall biosynthesis